MARTQRLFYTSQHHFWGEGKGPLPGLGALWGFLRGEHLRVSHSPIVRFVIKIITVLFLISLLSLVNCSYLNAQCLHFVPPVLLSIPPQGRESRELSKLPVVCGVSLGTLNWEHRS